MHVREAADHVTIIHSRVASHIFRQVRLDLMPLSSLSQNRLRRTVSTPNHKKIE
jgi:hypothetical protein